MKKTSKILRLSSKSKMMNIKIQLGKKSITFNLQEELLIDENLLDDELLAQPSYYGYLGTLKVKLQRQVNDLQLEVEKTYSTKYFHHKENVKSETNKAALEKIAKYKVEKDDEYISICLKLNKAKEQVGLIGVALESFDQRSRMIQSISANKRKEIN